MAVGLILGASAPGRDRESRAPPGSRRSYPAKQPVEAGIRSPGGRLVQTELVDPAAEDPGVLACAQVR
jgi:hypothetical protein